MNDGNLEIIYRNNKPYGIRNAGGLLFLFIRISKYPGQEDRYREEIEQQVRLADYLLSALKTTDKGVFPRMLSPESVWRE